MLLLLLLGFQLLLLLLPLLLLPPLALLPALPAVFCGGRQARTEAASFIPQWP